MATTDFSTDHLNGYRAALAWNIVKWLAARTGEHPDGGGCKAFYSPREWVKRGESYGKDAVLILCHDGGALAPFCNYNYGNWEGMKAFSDFLSSKGYYVECCTSWYSAVYRA